MKKRFMLSKTVFRRVSLFVSQINFLLSRPTTILNNSRPGSKSTGPKIAKAGPVSPAFFVFIWGEKITCFYVKPGGGGLFVSLF